MKSASKAHSDDDNSPPCEPFKLQPGGAGGEVEELFEALVSIDLSVHYSCSDKRSISRRHRAVTTDFSITTARGSIEDE